MAQAGGYDPVAPGSPVGGAAQTPYTGTHHTGSSQPGYQPTVASGGQYYKYVLVLLIAFDLLASD